MGPKTHCPACHRAWKEHRTAEVDVCLGELRRVAHRITGQPTPPRLKVGELFAVVIEGGVWAATGLLGLDLRPADVSRWDPKSKSYCARCAANLDGHACRRHQPRVHLAVEGLNDLSLPVHVSIVKLRRAVSGAVCCGLGRAHFRRETVFRPVATCGSCLAAAGLPQHMIDKQLKRLRVES